MNNNNALICAKNDIPSITNMVGEKRAMKFLSILKPELEVMTEEQYKKIRQGLFMLASNDLYPIKGRNIAFFIKYGNHAEIQLGYQAFVELASRSGVLINAQAVCKSDDFTFNRATSDISHFSGHDRNELNFNEIDGIYATCIFKGQRITEYMNRKEIEAHKNRFSKKDGKGSFSKAWVDSFAEMGKKTVIIKLCKRLPMISEKMQEVINFENETNFDLKNEKVVSDEKVKKATNQFLEDVNQEVEEIPAVGDSKLFDSTPSGEEYYGND